MKKHILAALIVGASYMGVATQASAVPVKFCSNGGIDLVTDGCISGTSAYYQNGGDGLYVSAGGGDTEAKVEESILLATGVAADITLYGKSDDDPDKFIVASSDGFSGTWQTVSGQVIRYITVKAANSYALYDVGNASAGIWSTEGILSNGGRQPELSHLSFWTEAASVPLPAAGWMLLAGLGGVFGLRRRKSS